jgi:hypothetical protein
MRHFFTPEVEQKIREIAAFNFAILRAIFFRRTSTKKLVKLKWHKILRELRVKNIKKI